jgi:acyl carrier protein
MNESDPKVLDAAITIVSDLFDVLPSDLSLDTMLSSVNGWDSLQHVNLIIDIERHFRIRLCEQEIVSIRGIRDIVDIVSVSLKKSPDA